MNVSMTMIVPASVSEIARQAAANISPAGTGSFVVPLYSGGEDPTHYISTGAIDGQFANVLSDANLLSELGQISLSDAQALIDQSTVVPLDLETAHETIERLGLRLNSPSGHPYKDSPP